VDGPQVDPELLATIANACRDAVQLHFSYAGRDGHGSTRHVEPSALVHSGYRWYLAAFDLDRDAWRTFRVDRILGSVRLGRRGRRRRVPGGNPASFVKEQLRTGEPEIARGRIRMAAPAAVVKARIPERWATVEACGETACIVTSSGPWSQTFLVRVALLGVPIDVLGPPDLADAARTLVAGLTAAAPTHR
jgi:predicted DNA-binding transcriptional regulator YafY